MDKRALQEMKKELQIAIKASLEAGKAIMEIYNSKKIAIQSKEDKSPLTEADLRANYIINGFLEPTGIPIISEENEQISYVEREKWERCWIIDPLDGTKEFVKKNGEFTTNIALVRNHKPTIGVIYAPALREMYFAEVSEKKAYKISFVDLAKEFGELLSTAEEIKPGHPRGKVKVVISRSHVDEDTLHFVRELKAESSKEVEMISKGSSLKFCLVAEGSGHIYPRFAPTMEWDTAAGQAICEAVGLSVTWRGSNEVVSYNRRELLNDHFLVFNEG